MTRGAQNQARGGIFFILIGIVGISLNDLIIKQLSGSYPLHQSVFLRSGIGIRHETFSVVPEKRRFIGSC